MASGYSVQLARLLLRVEGGIPSDIDGAGTYSVEEGSRLTLRDVWFGTQYPDPPPPGPRCGQVFE